MNILIIGTTDKLGGAAKVSWEIKEYAEQEGHKVSMFVADKLSNDPNVYIIPRKITEKYASIFAANERFINTDWILNTPQFLEADVVHCHNLHGRFFNLDTLVQMSKLKTVIWTLHDEWALTPHCAYTLEGTEQHNGLYVCPSIHTQPRILWNNAKALINKKNKQYEKMNVHVVTPSQWLLERTQNTTLGMQDCRLIPNGVDTNLFVPSNKQQAREQLNLPQDKKIVMFLATAGKANTWKGWVYAEEVIKAFRLDPSVLFLNVGNLQDESPEEQVEYRGHVNDPSELALYYSAADALLFTSIAENFPLVILEAMSCGLPIAAFDVGGVKEVLTHRETGYVASYKNAQELEQGIRWILSLSAEETQNIALRSHELISSSYDTSKMTHAYLELYKTLTSFE